MTTDQSDVAGAGSARTDAGRPAGDRGDADKPAASTAAAGEPASGRTTDEPTASRTTDRPASGTTTTELTASSMTDKPATGSTTDESAAVGKTATGTTGDGVTATGKTDTGKAATGKTDAATPVRKTDTGEPGDGVTATGKPADGVTATGKPGDGKAGKADGEASDPFSAFGPAPEIVLTRPRRVVRAVGRSVVHEWTLATVAALVLAVAMTWPTLRYPLYTIPQDYWDPTLQAWQMAWAGHILLTDPALLWQSNTFYPESWSFAFSDTLLGYAPAGMIGHGPEAAVLRYNIMFVLAHALATLGAYALARQLGSGRIGAAVAGVAYTYAPWLLAQAGHLHIVSNGGIPLALAMLARGHGWSLRYGYRPARRHAGWAFAGWLVAAWQLSLGFGIGLPFAYVLAGVVLVATLTWWLRRYWIRPVKHPFGGRLLLTDLVGGAVFAATGALLSLPYFKVAELHPNAKRSLGDVAIYSPPPAGFLTAPAESLIWGDLHEGARAALPWHPEMTLLPGFVLYALAAGGLFFSVWRLRHRLLLLAGVLVSMALSMGTEFFGGTFTYVPLFEHLPGWDGLRTPGRLMLWTTLLLGLLAAGALSEFGVRVHELARQRIPSWPGPWLRLATLLPLLLVLVEGLNTTPHPVVPTQPAAMRTVDGPLLVLPSNQNIDQNVMLWSTSRFQDVVNGGSGFTPERLAKTREVTLTFPDPASITHLRELGVRTVVVLRDRVAGTPWETTIDAPVDSLGIRREEIGEAVVFRL